MWNRDQAPSAPENQPSSDPATQPRPAVTSSSSGLATVIGESMKIQGTVSCDEDLHLAGEFHGKLHVSKRLTVGPKAKVEAEVKAQEATVAGSVKGNVESIGRLTLKAGANLVGDVRTAGIVIEDGAYFKGGIDIIRSPKG